MQTVTLTIDGKQVTVGKGRSVLEAALEHGYKIPFYCYHPGLGVDGSCRVCIVRIEKMPKLQTACSTPCADGMVVHTQTSDVVEARASVFEFLLINHPLDCPVCDKGGECPLQDFSYTFGPNESRMEFPRRVFDGEGVKADVDFGPTLMLNRNRCILCTRCVRFMRDIDGDAQINIIDRGYGSEIATFQEQGVHSLISGNLMDVCPVGAITTRDYRFKARPWDNPSVVDTICTLCSKGCNTSVWVKAKPEWAKGARLVRITPRLNRDVNGYWMCDIGRFDYHWVEGDQRLRRPLLRDRTGTHNPVSWHDALVKLRDLVAAAAAGRPASPKFLVSGHASLEELFLVGRIVSGLGGGRADIALTWSYRHKEQSARTTFHVPPVDAPNLEGARDLGVTIESESTPERSVAALRHAVEGGEVSALFLLDPGPAGTSGDLAWLVQARRAGTLPVLVVQAPIMSELANTADVVLPGAAWLEKNAAHTNEQGHVQAAAQAVAPPGDAMEDWQILVNVGAALGVTLDYATSTSVRTDLAAALSDNPRYATLTSLQFDKPVSARNWLDASNPSERWKWDFMFQDVAPFKFEDGPEATPAPDFIPLRKVDAD